MKQLIIRLLNLMTSMETIALLFHKFPASTVLVSVIFNYFEVISSNDFTLERPFKFLHYMQDRLMSCDLLLVLIRGRMWSIEKTLWLWLVETT